MRKAAGNRGFCHIEGPAGEELGEQHKRLGYQRVTAVVATRTALIDHEDQTSFNQ
jgi:hypothetical protein